MKRIWAVAAALSVLTGSILTYAADSPDTVLKTAVDKIIRILKDPDLRTPSNKEVRSEKLYNVASSVFDIEILSMLALGRQWRRFSKDQQSQFSDYFSRLIFKSYVTKLEGETFDSITVEYQKVEMLDTTSSGRERADVYTRLIHQGVVTPVDYRMMKAPGSDWKIYDVKVEGVSMVANYREQYNNRFSDTPEMIIEELRQKVGQ